MAIRPLTVCDVCKSGHGMVSMGIGVCAACLRERPSESLPVVMERHRGTRMAEGLVPDPPRDPNGLRCGFCANECMIGQGQAGYCGLRRNVLGRLEGGVTAGNFSWYFDPLPTNCVADWVCPAGTGVGYPRFAHRNGPERGYKNLAVFSQVCSFDCAFCQNEDFRRLTLRPTWHTAEDLADAVDGLTSCICYFGGDPSPQMPVFLKASRLARKRAGGRILRICWETNGSFNSSFLDAAMDISLVSGGCVKFDLKAFTSAIHRALTGADNLRTLENFTRAAARIHERPEPPPLIASTLLVPGYIDAQEVGKIAAFIAGLDRCIPYSLLAFAPHLHMTDLPLTSRSQAEECLSAAKDAGLRRVRLGNIHLLGL